MICSTCKSEGLKSYVYEGGGASTLMGHMPYYDEDGIYHSHDPNRTSWSYICSKGHKWSESTLMKCPNCEYGI